MRRVSRGPAAPPEALSKKDDRKETELDRARRYYAGGRKKKAYPFSAYKAPEVAARLEALFHGKCAYCEADFSASSPTDIEHFRPKGAVHDDDGHPGYWWLAMAWENLLPSCIDCNRRRTQPTPDIAGSLEDVVRGLAEKSLNKPQITGKKDAFPLIGTRANWTGEDPPSLEGERPVLLNPCEDDIDEHLEFYVGRDPLVGIVLPRRSPPRRTGDPDEPTVYSDDHRGLISIGTYGLNRLGLVQARTRLLRQLDFMTNLALELFALAARTASGSGPKRLGAAEASRARQTARALERLGWIIIGEVKAMAAPDQPYSAVARAWLISLREDVLASRPA